MGEVIAFKRPNKNGQLREMATLAGEIVEKPANQDEYLKICRRFLIDTEYNKVLMGIMDHTYYIELCEDEPHIAKIIEAYYTFTMPKIS